MLISGQRPRRPLPGHDRPAPPAGRQAGSQQPEDHGLRQCSSASASPSPVTATPRSSVPRTTTRGKGGAWIFSRTGSTWSQGQKIGPPTDVITPPVANFGNSVAISGDGKTALIAGELDNGQTGAVWVYVQSPAGYVEQARMPSVGVPVSGLNAGGADQFGHSVALSGDGNTALVGGPDNDGSAGAGNNGGAAWVFTRSGTSWAQLGSKIAPAVAPCEQLGPLGHSGRALFGWQHRSDRWPERGSRSRGGVGVHPRRQRLQSTAGALPQPRVVARSVRQLCRSFVQRQHGVGRSAQRYGRYRGSGVGVHTIRHDLGARHEDRPHEQPVRCLRERGRAFRRWATPP